MDKILQDAFQGLDDVINAAVGLADNISGGEHVCNSQSGILGMMLGGDCSKDQDLGRF